MTNILIALLAIFLVLWAKPWLDRHYVPYTLLVVLIGFVGSELMVAVGIDTGIRYSNFAFISQYCFIPILIFNTALNIDKSSITRDWFSVLSLSLPVFLLTVLLSAGVTYFAIAHASGFPWLAAFITASLLAGTNVRAISGLLANMGMSARILSLLQTESLLTETLSVVLFGFLLMLAEYPEMASHWYWLFMLIWQVSLGVLVGYLVSRLVLALLSKQTRHEYQVVLTVVMVYLAYLISQDVLHASGVIAVFTCGWRLQSVLRAAQDNFVFCYWQSTMFLATMLMFLILGVTVTVDIFTHRWLAMLIGIVAVLLARLLGVFSIMSLFSHFSWIKTVSLKEQSMLSFAALRGALPIALVFSIPESLEYWWTIQAIAFGVVLFSIFIQAPIFLRCLKRAIESTAQLR